MKADNLFTDIPAELPAELIQEIATGERVRIERILSKGHCSAKGFWYDQNWVEWVLLLQGAAGLEMADRPAIIELKPGDHLLIPSGVKHRVAWTARNETTIWLAVHINRPDESSLNPNNHTTQDNLFE
jgi:cupin 2 domain-containing protein